MVPFVDFEALIEEPVMRWPDFAAPVVLFGKVGIVATDGGQYPFPGEFFRVMEDLSQGLRLLRLGYLPEKRKENVRPHLREEAISREILPVAIVVTATGGIPEQSIDGTDHTPMLSHESGGILDRKDKSLHSCPTGRSPDLSPAKFSQWRL